MKKIIKVSLPIFLYVLVAIIVLAYPMQIKDIAVKAINLIAPTITNAFEYIGQLLL